MLDFTREDDLKLTCFFHSADKIPWYSQDKINQEMTPIPLRVIEKPSGVPLRQERKESYMMKRNISKGIATCLALAMMVSIVPAKAATTDAADQTNTNETTEAAVPDIASGSAASTPTATATSTATATATATATPNLSAYKPATTTAAARGGSCRVRVTWTKVTGASGYYIYSRPSTEVSYTKIATVKSGSTVEYVKKSLTQNTTYYFRVAAYRTVNGVDVEGDLSTAVSAKTAAVSATSKAAKKYSTKASFTKSPAYKTYKKMQSAMKYTKSFAIPGMKTTNVAGFSCTSMVPQGMCLAGSYFLITAYDYKKTDYSVVYVVSRSSKSYITTIVLPSKAKVGGIAYDGTNIWISKGKAVASFPYTVVTDAVNSGKAYSELASYRSTYSLDSTASFMGCYNNILWVGTFSQSSSTMKGFSVTNKTTVPSLVPTYTMAVPSKTKGITFDSEGTMILTRSYRVKKAKSGYISQIRTYKPSFGSPSASGKVLKNSALKTTKMPPLVSGVAVYGTYTYALFSSSYYSTCKYPVDRVIALKTNNLVL